MVPATPDMPKKRLQLVLPFSLPEVHFLMFVAMPTIITIVQSVESRRLMKK